MKTQWSDSQTPIMAESGISWKLITPAAATLTDVKIKVYSSLRITAVAAGIVTIDGLPSIYMQAGEVAIINVGLGDPEDSKYVKLTTAMNVWVSQAIDASRTRQQLSVE